jgi:hypothetical protein
MNARPRSTSANVAKGRQERISAIVAALAGVGFGVYGPDKRSHIE